MPSGDIKAVLFDFFGVLYEEPHLALFNKHKDDFNDEQREELRAMGDAVDLGNAEADAYENKLAELAGISIPALHEKIWEIHPVNIRLVRLISSLKENYTTGLISNAHHDYIDPILEQNNVGNQLDITIISSRVGYIKPDPEIFMLVIHELGIQPDQAIFIDDRQVNVDAATKLGIHAHLYTGYDALIEYLQEQGIRI